MCARFQSSHVQTPADRQSRAHPPRPIHVRDGSLPQAYLLRRSLSPNRRGRRFAFRAWTAHPLDAGVSPAPRRLGYLPCPLRVKPFHRAQRAAQPLHSLSRVSRPLLPLRFLREPRNPAATAVSRPRAPLRTIRPPPSTPSRSPEPKLPLDDTKPPRSSLIKSEPPPSRASSSPTRHRARRRPPPPLRRPHCGAPPSEHPRRRAASREALSPPPCTHTHVR